MSSLLPTNIYTAAGGFSAVPPTYDLRPYNSIVRLRGGSTGYFQGLPGQSLTEKDIGKDFVRNAPSTTIGAWSYLSNLTEESVRKCKLKLIAVTKDSFSFEDHEGKHIDLERTVCFYPRYETLSEWDDSNWLPFDAAISLVRKYNEKPEMYAQHTFHPCPDDDIRLGEIDTIFGWTE